MRRGICSISLLALFAFGCSDDPPAPPPVGDSSVDAPRPDVGRRDAPAADADAGPSGPIIDGVVDDFEWRNGVVEEAEVETDREGSTLTRLRAVLHDEQLVVAVEGSLVEGDTLAVFLDRALGESEGIEDLASLADDEGALDTALSTDLSTAAAFRADVAFGTQSMPHTLAEPDDTAGWRDLSDPSELLPIEMQQLVCGEAACEAALPLDALGGTAPRTIALFARVLRADSSAWTNQTLPEDDASDPATVSMLLELVDGDLEPDAGIPDAGTDAEMDAEMGVVVDGTLAPGEWDGAALVDDVIVTTDGTAFAGNALRTLRVIRDASDVYVALEGDLSAGNAMLVYLDTDVGGGDGIVSTAELDDPIGALDLAFSTKPIFLPAELRIDYVWGTLEFGRTASVDGRMGWRDVATNPSSFRSLAVMTACSANACETQVPISELGVVGTLGFFVRLGSASNENLSNQTLPMDADPAFVTVYLEVP